MPSTCECHAPQETGPRFDDRRRTVWLKCLTCGREVTEERLRAWASDEAAEALDRCGRCGAWMEADALALCDSCIEATVPLPVSA